jgi:hypothetical protein
MWVEPISLRPYFAALTAEDQYASLRELLLSETCADDVKIRAITYLCGEKSPEPRTDYLARPDAQGSPRAKPDGSLLTLEALRSLIDRGGAPVAVPALAAYGFLTGGNDPSVARLVLSRSGPNVDFRLVAVALRYWPSVAGGIAFSGRESCELVDYDSSYAEAVLSGCALPLSDAERVLLCSMLEDDRGLARRTRPFPDRRRLVAEAARSVLHAELGVWLPFDTRLAARLALGQLPEGAAVLLCQESPVPIQGRWGVPDEESVQLELTNVSLRDVVLHLTGTVSVDAPSSSLSCDLSPRGNSALRLGRGGTATAVLSTTGLLDQEDMDWLRKQQAAGHPMWFRFGHGLGDAEAQGWLGYLGAVPVPFPGNTQQK